MKKSRFEINIIQDTFHFDDQTKSTIKLDELYQGCPKRDCIPAIDKPKFIKAEDAVFLQEKDVVVLVNYHDIQRAYALKILQSHEIVNDWFGATPIAISYCPLCGSAVAIKRTLDGQDVEFGVSGFLHNSDLVMYDRKTESLWGQITGRAIVGPKTGTQLKKISAQMVSWGSVKKQYPQIEVLSLETGYQMDYSKLHYGDYDSTDKLYVPVPLSDARLHIKSVVYGVEAGDENIAFEESYLAEKRLIHFQLAGKNATIEYQDKGLVSAYFDTNKEEITTTHVFWFAWYNFHQNTFLIYKKI